MLKDSFGRIHDYLRISLTDKCNLRCTYCNPIDLPKGFFDGCTRMSAAEIENIAEVFVKEGVKKIRLTGGEPLVRRDAREIIERLSKFPVELAITTNGVFVHEFIDTFEKAGIRSVNVSLDSLNREVYHSITGRDEFDRVTRNIKLLLQHDFHVKINVVVMRDVNDMEVTHFVAWTKNRPLHVRFIEFMPFAGNQWDSSKVVTANEMMERVSAELDIIKLKDEPNATAKKYKVIGHRGSFAFITTLSNQFCNECNRLRLTAEGKIKNCLFGAEELDLLGALRKGEPLSPLIQQSVRRKYAAMGGQFEKGFEHTDANTLINRSMIRIGG